jgi:putative methyltransferase (TIGR04325 family)
MFFHTIKFDWRVVETVGMVEEARNLESSELHFFSRIKSAVEDTDVIHLVHSSGTLQYISEPYSSLEELVNVEARFMLLSRLGVTTEKNEIITIQRHMMSANGPCPAPKGFKDEICIYPFQYPVKSKVESVLSKNYRIEFINDDPSGKLSVGSHEIIGVTYFCKKKQSA